MGMVPKTISDPTTDPTNDPMKKFNNKANNTCNIISSISITTAINNRKDKERKNQQFLLLKHPNENNSWSNRNCAQCTNTPRQEIWICSSFDDDILHHSTMRGMRGMYGMK